jgi:DNA primase
MRIPQHFIDDLIARADIVEVVGSRVSLKQAGREYKAVCPFHAEKTPSFTVSPGKGFYHCFGCGAHGTALGFLMEYDKLEFPEAVEALAEMLGVEVPRVETGMDASPTAELYGILQEADRLYRRNLRMSPVAIEYLKRRGIDGATAARYGMGYATDAWDALLKALGGDDQRIALLRAAGLVIRNDQGRQYDRFRHRVMFPIRDTRGRVVGFGGRVLDATEPKYLNSPETPVFHKGQALYGLYEAIQSRGRLEQIVVVEGYLDVASLAQHGFDSSVATLGTATTPKHLSILTRLTDVVVFCFDGDRAGRAAAWSALETALPMAGGRKEIRFLLLPEGHDPDTLVRERGAEAFGGLLARAQPLSEFLVEQLAQRVNLANADGSSRLAAIVKPLLARVRDGLYRQKLLEQVAARIGTSIEQLEASLAATPAPAGQDQGGRSDPALPLPAQMSLIGKALTLALHHPRAAAQLGVVAGLEAVSRPGASLLRRVLEVAAERPQMVTAGLLERFRDSPEGDFLNRLVASPSLDEPEQALAVLRDCAARIVEAHRRERLSALIERGPALTDEEKAEASALQRAARGPAA